MNAEILYFFLFLIALIALVWGIPALLWKTKRQTLVAAGIGNAVLLLPFVAYGIMLNTTPEHIGDQMLFYFGMPITLIYWLVGMLVIAMRKPNQ